MYLAEKVIEAADQGIGALIFQAEQLSGTSDGKVAQEDLDNLSKALADWEAYDELQESN